MTPPYTPGDLVEISLPREPPRGARVSTLLPTDSSLPANRWMLTCRWVDDNRLVGAPLHCGDDGVGRQVRPGGGTRVPPATLVGHGDPDLRTARGSAGRR